jgi:hypothetical protein
MIELKNLNPAFDRTIELSDGLTRDTASRKLEGAQA